MQYNVAQLLKDPIRSTRNHRVNEDVNTDDGSSETVKGHLSLMRTDKGIRTNARLELEVWAVCGCCLKRFRLPVSMKIEEEYLPTVNISTGKSLRVTEGAEGWFIIDYRHILKLDEAIHHHEKAFEAYVSRGLFGPLPFLRSGQEHPTV